MAEDRIAAEAERQTGRGKGGESGGGAYPNPHSGKDAGGFRGGDSEAGYHGPGQLGEDDTGENANAPAKGS